MLAHFGHHLLTALPVPLLPMLRSDFALDYTQSGLLVSAFTLSYGIGQLPAGWLAGRIGPRLMITVGISGVGLAGFLVGLSPSYIMTAVLLALMGLAGGGYHPAAPPMISASVEPNKRGSALGLHMIGGGASYFLAPLIAAAIATVWGWRGPFIVLAIPTVILGLVFYLLLGRVTTEEVGPKKTAASTTEAPPAPGHMKALVVFLILSTFTMAVFASTIPFIPLFMVDHFGVSKETAAALVAVIYSAGLWAGTLGGYLSDRWGTVPIILTVCFLAGPTLYLLNVLPFGIANGALLVFIGMIHYIRMPVSEAYIVSHTSARNRSPILGIYYFTGQEVGAVLTPAMGYLIDRFDFNTAFTVAGAALLVVTLACSLWLRHTR
ncbi:MAG: MFS transporter [Chloroflexota bacterium]